MDEPGRREGRRDKWKGRQIGQGLTGSIPRAQTTGWEEVMRYGRWDGQVAIAVSTGHTSGEA